MRHCQRDTRKRVTPVPKFSLCDVRAKKIEKMFSKHLTAYPMGGENSVCLIGFMTTDLIGSVIGSGLKKLIYPLLCSLPLYLP